MYKPNFCCDCGAVIERARWRVWTSRRFCADCAPRFRKAQILSHVFAGTILFVVGLALGRAARPAPPPLIVQRGQLAEAAALPSKDGERLMDAETKTGAAVPLTSTWQDLNYKVAGLAAKFVRNGYVCKIVLNQYLAESANFNLLVALSTVINKLLLGATRWAD